MRAFRHRYGIHLVACFHSGWSFIWQWVISTLNPNRSLVFNERCSSYSFNCRFSVELVFYLAVSDLHLESQHVLGIQWVVLVILIQLHVFSWAFLSPGSEWSAPWIPSALWSLMSAIHHWNRTHLFACFQLGWSFTWQWVISTLSPFSSLARRERCVSFSCILSLSRFLESDNQLKILQF
jgi:hypothetical protein